MKKIYIDEFGKKTNIKPKWLSKLESDAAAQIKWENEIRNGTAKISSSGYYKFEHEYSQTNCNDTTPEKYTSEITDPGRRLFKAPYPVNYER